MYFGSGFMEKTIPCPKFMKNGPCGGVRNGKCEVHDGPCVWVLNFKKMGKDILDVRR